MQSFLERMRQTMRRPPRTHSIAHICPGPQIALANDYAIPSNQGGRHTNGDTGFRAPDSSNCATVSRLPGIQRRGAPILPLLLQPGPQLLIVQYSHHPQVHQQLVLEVLQVELLARCCRLRRPQLPSSGLQLRPLPRALDACSRHLACLLPCSSCCGWRCRAIALPTRRMPQCLEPCRSTLGLAAEASSMSPQPLPQARCARRSCERCCACIAAVRSGTESGRLAGQHGSCGWQAGRRGRGLKA